MTRPRKDDSAPSARERLEAAFWEMLAEMPFSQITVSALASRARVNHNTLYYHFSSIEEMARELFELNMMPELPAMMLPMLSGGVSDLSAVADVEGLSQRQDLKEHFARARLFAISDSPILASILRDSVESLWLETVGLKHSDLAQSEQDQLSFVFGGLMALIADAGEDASPERMAAVMESPMGNGVLKTLASIANAQRDGRN